jgi:CRISPR-associated endonuclease/helicase Cas3
VDNASGRMDDLLLETLGFAEGRLLSIHPFTDFNGRVTRLLLRELLRQLELPPVDLVPTDPAGEAAHRAALQAGDNLNWLPLMKVWQQRFEQFSDSPL